MSIEALSKFSEKVAQEPALQAETEKTLGIPLNELMEMNAEQLQAANTDYPALVVDLAAKYDYEFTKEELLQQITVLMNPQGQGELNDEALEAVAGGKLFQPPGLPGPIDSINPVLPPTVQPFPPTIPPHSGGW